MLHQGIADKGQVRANILHWRMGKHFADDGYRDLWDDGGQTGIGDQAQRPRVRGPAMPSAKSPALF